MERWPNLFVVGVARAATTSLAYYLGQHPEVYMSPVKEPYFFTRYHPDWVGVPQEKAAYLELFRDADDAKYRGEATPAYFWDHESAGSIKAASPEARILISLREPVARAHSEYLLLRRSSYERRPSFAAVVSEELRLDEGERGDDPRYNYISRGLYTDGVTRFREMFGRDRVHVLFFEEFVENPRDQMRTVFEFLALDPEWADRIELAAKERGGAPRNKLAEALLYSPGARALARRAVPPAARSVIEAAFMRRPNHSNTDTATAARNLHQIYTHDRKRLENLLGRPAPWSPVQARADSP
jgi:hypothetical protein